MTKKDFEIIADILNESKAILTDERFRAIIGLFIKRLKEANEYFDPILFCNRCWGVEKPSASAKTEIR